MGCIRVSQRNNQSTDGTEVPLSSFLLNGPKCSLIEKTILFSRLYECVTKVSKRMGQLFSEMSL